MARSLISVQPFDRAAIGTLFQRAEEHLNAIQRRRALSRHGGARSVGLCFFEASTRTRSSFELAARHLGYEVVRVDGSSSSVSKGETLLDTARTLAAMHLDALVIRHSSSGAALYVQQRVDTAVLNAGDGWNEHPTQALLDAFTLRRHGLNFEKLIVTICGDILHSRVARSNIWLLKTLGATVRLAGPRTLLPVDAAAAFGVEVFDRIEPALDGADVVMTLRVQAERLQGALLPSLRDYAKAFCLTSQRLRLASPHALVMHPGPINRGVEIGSEVADGGASLILEQVESGVAIRAASLEWALAAPAAALPQLS